MSALQAPLLDIAVSMVGSAAGTATKNAKVSAVIDGIKSGRWAVAVNAIRDLYCEVLKRTGAVKEAKAAVELRKKALPAILWSGTFRRRGDGNLTTYSNLLCADLDDVPPEVGERTLNTLKSDLHVFTAFRSPTGTGLKVVFCVGGDGSAHRENFLAVQRHVKESYTLEVDPSCRNIERLCFVSLDPEIFVNPEAVPLTPIPEQPRAEQRPSADGVGWTPTSRRQIAEGLLGSIRWESSTRGFVPCPGHATHTTASGEQDCRIDLDGAPTISCFHQHCAGIVAAVNRELRSQIGKAECAGAGTIFGGFSDDEPVAVPQWPAPLDPRAFHGLAGDVVNAIDPHTESDPAAVLLMFLSAFGNLVGATGFFTAESRRHYARLFAVFCGDTSKGRKGSAWSNVQFVLSQADPDWLEHCTGSGLSSGEGLIHAVRDQVVRQIKNSDGTVEEKIEDEGVADKRLLVIEEEFSSVLKVATRDGNTVSDLLRRAWDSGHLQTMTRRSPLQATGAHISLIGHITKADLSKQLAESDALNGFGNRFLWLAVRRSKLLPEGGAIHSEDLGALALKLRRAIDSARKSSELKRTPSAKEFWREIYAHLSADRAGLFGAITSRAEAQVMRLALIYALLDMAPAIDVVHLQAALAVWRFCDDSARFIFGEALGDRSADRILDELRSSGSRGLTRSELREVFRKNITTARLDASLELLQRLNLAGYTKEPSSGAGRPAVVWRATRSQAAASKALASVEGPRPETKELEAVSASEPEPWPSDQAPETEAETVPPRDKEEL